MQLEQLFFESDEMLFSWIKNKGCVCISTERELIIRKLLLNTRSRAILDKNFFSYITLLRTVPTKYKGFCTRLGPCGKSRFLQGLLESMKKHSGSQAFFRDN